MFWDSRWGSILGDALNAWWMISQAGSVILLKFKFSSWDKVNIKKAMDMKPAFAIYLSLTDVFYLPCFNLGLMFVLFIRFDCISSLKSHLEAIQLPCCCLEAERWLTILTCSFMLSWLKHISWFQIYAADLCQINAFKKMLLENWTRILKSFITGTGWQALDTTIFSQLAGDASVHCLFDSTGTLPWW